MYIYDCYIYMYDCYVYIYIYVYVCVFFWGGLVFWQSQVNDWKCWEDKLSLHSLYWAQIYAFIVPTCRRGIGNPPVNHEIYPLVN